MHQRAYLPRLNIQNNINYDKIIVSAHTTSANLSEIMIFKAHPLKPIYWTFSRYLHSDISPPPMAASTHTSIFLMPTTPHPFHKSPITHPLHVSERPQSTRIYPVTQTQFQLERRHYWIYPQARCQNSPKVKADFSFWIELSCYITWFFRRYFIFPDFQGRWRIPLRLHHPLYASAYSFLKLRRPPLSNIHYFNPHSHPPLASAL